VCSMSRAERKGPANDKAGFQCRTFGPPPRVGLQTGGCYPEKNYARAAAGYHACGNRDVLADTINPEPY